MQRGEGQVSGVIPAAVMAAREGEQTDLTIIVVSWNVAADLRECLESICLAAQPPLKMEIIVVDNASSDGTVDMLRTQFPTVRVIANGENVGFSAANNQGMALAQGRYILCLNPDTLVRKDTVRTCLEYMESHPDVGLLGCKIVYPDGTIQYESARNFPTLMDTFVDSLYLHMLFPRNRVFGHHLMTYWDHLDSRDVPCIAGAFMLFRRQVLDQVGPFDAAIPMYLDDIDLCYRVTLAKWRTYYLASTEIVHKGGRSEASTGRDRGPVNAAARYVFFLKHRGRRAARAFRLVILCGALFRLSVAFVTLPIRQLHCSRSTFLGRLLISRQLALLRWGLTYRSPSATRGM
jgi:O-antigen biosynthesis protein